VSDFLTRSLPLLDDDSVSVYLVYLVYGTLEQAARASM
jgi:hypothetical protein